MNQIITLDQLPPERCGIVERVETEGDMRRRFLDLGLIENTLVECIGRSPQGDPSAYLIRGAVIAIRAKNCRGIFIRPIEKEAAPWD